MFKQQEGVFTEKTAAPVVVEAAPKENPSDVPAVERQLL